MPIQLTEQEVTELPHELETLQLIKIMKLPVPNTHPQRLSDKYRGIIGEKERIQLHGHTQQMRNEWKAI